MNYNKFGKTDLLVSEIGFGAWGIGGPAMVGKTAIGWGKVDDSVSMQALKKSFDLGITFYDTADFYGFGHSEELIGKVFGNRNDVVIATKVGHRIENGNIVLDYSKNHILNSCEKSLKRLQREQIDFYQLHSAKFEHLQNGECTEAMEQLKNEGKIRYWGISLNTFNPYPEGEFFLDKNLGDGFQLVLNIINQRALKLINDSHKKDYGIISRIPLHFGLLTGKFNKNTSFKENDHRNARLQPEFLSELLDELENVWPIDEKYKISKTSFALSFILNHTGISTVIPGIKTPEQAQMNTKDIIKIDEEDLDYLHKLFENKFDDLVKKMI
jgi:aryl-alcohol dehydrogenase-like predicted oxidoreductase